MIGKRILFLALLGIVVLLMGGHRALATPPVSRPTPRHRPPGQMCPASAERCRGLVGGTGGEAAAPTALGTSFTYQGYLESGGGPVNDTCDFQFSLWDAAGSGTQIGTTQAVNGQGVTDGRFTVQLDFGGATASTDKLVGCKSLCAVRQEAAAIPPSRRARN